MLGHGIVVVKFWVRFIADEQIPWFEDRERTPHKRWKITDEDWWNRNPWFDYEDAVNTMVERVSSCRPRS